MRTTLRNYLGATRSPPIIAIDPHIPERQGRAMFFGGAYWGVRLKRKTWGRKGPGAAGPRQGLVAPCGAVLLL